MSPDETMADAPDPLYGFGDEPSPDVARLIYSEGIRVRDLQEARIDGIRSRSTSLISLVSGAVVIATGVGGDDLSTGWIAVAVASLALAVATAVVIHAPRRGYLAGPDLAKLNDRDYATAKEPGLALRDVALDHWHQYRANESGLVRRLQWAFTAELVLSATAIITVLFAAVA